MDFLGHWSFDVCIRYVKVLLSYVQILVDPSKRDIFTRRFSGTSRKSDISLAKQTVANERIWVLLGIGHSVCIRYVKVLLFGHIDPAKRYLFTRHFSETSQNSAHHGFANKSMQERGYDFPWAFGHSMCVCGASLEPADRAFRRLLATVTQNFAEILQKSASWICDADRCD